MGSKEIRAIGYRQGFAFIGVSGRRGANERRATSKKDQVSVAQVFEIDDAAATRAGAGAQAHAPKEMEHRSPTPGGSAGASSMRSQEAIKEAIKKSISENIAGAVKKSIKDTLGLRKKAAFKVEVEDEPEEDSEDESPSKPDTEASAEYSMMEKEFESRDDLPGVEGAFRKINYIYRDKPNL